MNERYADLAKDVLKSSILAGVTVWIVWITIFALLGKFSLARLFPSFYRPHPFFSQ